MLLAAFAFGAEVLRTFAYIDGFNLYNRALIKTPQFKWLGLRLFCASFLADNDRCEIKYYTARVFRKTRPRTTGTTKRVLESA